MAPHQPILYLDVGSPFAYLAAERAAGVLGLQPRLAPILLGGLFRLNGRSSWALGDVARRRAGMADVEARAARYGLPPLRWPDPWPTDYLLAMRTITAAGLDDAETGSALLMASLRRMFVVGDDLGQEDGVRAACADAGLDADAALAAALTPRAKQALRDATEAAHARGVIGVPTLAVGEQLLWGDDRLEEGAALVR
jgi:2-hydroxychromene-2-carboxylate isomerase